MRSYPHKESCLGWLAAAGLTLAPLCSAAAQDGTDPAPESNVDAFTRVIFEAGIDTTERFAASMKTTDIGASEQWCSAKPSDGDGCEAEEGHNFTPKNLGNVFCLPIDLEEEDYRVTDRCQALLDEGRNRGCKPNANVGKNACTPGALRVGPACSWRTPKQGIVEWDWMVSRGDDQWIVDCTQRGYDGPTYVGEEDEQETTASGCLGHGRLSALGLGDAPRRPCRRGETEVKLQLGAF